MTDSEGPFPVESGPDLRIGQAERDSARKALQRHVDGQRIDSAEYDRRWLACRQAASQAELLRAFADLPAPHPTLPSRPTPAVVDDTDDTYLAVMQAILWLPGLAVAIVLGAVYDAWWTLAIPVLLSAAVVYVEHHLSLRRMAKKEPRPTTEL